MVVIAFWVSLMLCLSQAHHTGHHFVPVPFPYPAGSYRHTSSVVNIPVHHERLVIVKKPGPHQHHHGHSHGYSYGHSHDHGHGHNHAYSHGHMYSVQETRIPPPSNLPPMVHPRPPVNYNQASLSNRYPYFEDVGFLLDPRLAQRSVWLDQFPDVF